MRLNLFIAKSGYAARRKADSLIKNGQVTVNGNVIHEPFFNVTVKDKVRINKSLLHLKEKIYILFNKPSGVTTTLYDKFAKVKVTDFLPASLRTSRDNSQGSSSVCQHKQGVYPVGRLDKESSGLLILTNDGSLCYRVTHPKFSVEKEYLIKLKGILKSCDCQMAVKGVRDEIDHLKVDSIEIINKERNDTVCKVIVREGKKRHLRRLFKSLGFRVRELKRIRIGGLILGKLGLGKCRIIPKDKIYRALFPGSRPEIS
ncbi:MAG: pseudouridine synthase [Omnitrophica bacterium]|nr:pseudouridine synthase [Candidatus Omnitrophota bacterium]